MAPQGVPLLLHAGKTDEGREYAGKYQATIDVSSDPVPQEGKVENGYPQHRVQKRGFVSAIAPFRMLASRSLITKESHEGDCIYMDVELSGQPEIKHKGGDHIAIWPILVDFAVSDVVKIVLSEIEKDKAAENAFLASTRLAFTRILAYMSTLNPNINWLSLPLSFVIESIPTMSPRCYSISNSNITSPKQVSITVSVKPTQLALKPETAIFGLTTLYLALVGTSPCQDPGAIQKQSPLQTIQAQIRRSNFKLPTAFTVPLVLVAAGTGIAHMPAFILERASK
ncbi:uncharacterized protein Z519_02726 [Cladophialophora bantiana CBS 173.52]|uniref:FAD-binding FR-type domain-containing protein n=1 Tax=Cladophialophora bantiana (strain ATCC 10958 / CBS 173.52 / CDC B-1940 / NIH 8579) TaxID=1442370 RepID=A0A0D2IKI5_CLAB1|nr:uncharacterized protein Z519_02726 [Cladophialophora bantiana CBS 173.52]KIW97334.1 hypothetical protein Z519_02726 [Cladophialophora bantiana CBS 173.52]